MGSSSVQPQVISKFPLDGAVNVPGNTSVAAVFNKQMNAASLLFPATPTMTLSAGSTPVSGIVFYNAVTKTALFTPSAPLQGAVVHTAKLTTGVTDLAGKGLVADVQWSFTTATTTSSTNVSVSFPPAVVSTNPANGGSNIALNTPIAATFNTTMDATTLTTATVVLTNSIGPVTGVVSYDGPGQTVSFAPSNPLVVNTDYTMILRETIKDSTGTALGTSFSWTFTTGNTAPPPPPPTPKFAYVANEGSNDVSAFTINATTGALTSIGAAVAAGSYPTSVTVDPSGKFAYVANYDSHNVSAYTINATTGALTSIGAGFAAGTNPLSVTVDPSGKFAYVANFSSNNVSAYTINATTGVLTSIGACFAAGTQPRSITTTK